MEGHVEGMLDRDQRTAKLRFFDNSDNSKQVPKTTYSFQERTTAVTTTEGSYCCPTRTRRSGATSSYLSCRSGYLLNTFQSVTNVLIVVFLTLVTLPTAYSAPTSMGSRMMSKQMWINPCDISQDAMIVENTSEISSEELSKIVQQAGIALQNANNFKDKFANATFNKDIDELHKDFKMQKLDWLEMDLHKSLGEEIPQDHLENLKIEDALLDVYGYLQKVAVGLEQVEWDQQDNEGAFKNEFAEAQQQLQRVLCELQETVMVHGIKMRTDVTRDVMNVKDRHLDTTGRKNRDWIIYREYMNTLEYIMEAFKHLSKSSPSGR